MDAVFWLVLKLLDLYWWIVIISVVMSWLFAFNVINYSNPVVRSIANFVHEATEPVLGFVRRFMPNLGSIDISPIVVLLGLMALQILISNTIAPLFGVNTLRLAL